MKLIACIDGSIYSQSVTDHAGWAAQRLHASIELLQILGRREPSTLDLSGSIAVGAQAQLLTELAELDAERAKLVLKRGRLVLEEAKARLATQGVVDVSISLRHGDLLESLAEQEAAADLIVIGKRGEAADFARLHLGSNLERVIRASQKPVLVASRAFKPIKSALIAFDGGPSALKAVEHVARSSLFAGLTIHVVTVGRDDPATRGPLEAAAAHLRARGLAVEAHFASGQPDKAIAALVESLGIDLLIMGAYGHSRIRSLVIGSTTTEMIRSCKIPVLLFR
jgi:nucleotide-binding universal stress UspA family protein